MKRRIVSRDKLAFNLISYTVITLVALICLLPFLMILSGSLTDEAYLAQHGYSLFPMQFSLDAYRIALRNPGTILNAYGVTICLTLAGTVLGLFLSSMTAYVLQRKDFAWRNYFAYYIFFTTLFSGGLVPWYILMINLGMKNNYLSMLVPGLFNVFNIIILRTFMSGIPSAITESAKIDGAGDFAIFVKLMLPLSGPALVTIGLFIALAYWNEWYNAMLFISKSEMYPLQFYLYNLINSMQAKNTLMMGSGTQMEQLPEETIKLAMTVIVMGPIFLLYPFLQKYFVKGITIGSVKG